MSRFFVLILVLIVLCPQGHLFAQLQGQAEIDRLIQRLPALNDDTIKLKTLDSIARGYNNINPDEGINYGLKSLKLAEQLDQKKFLGLANNTLGIGHFAKAEYPEALEYYFKALKYYEDQKITNKVADVLSNIGTVYLYQNNYNKALEYYFKALPLYEGVVKKIGLANTLNGIGSAYASQKNYLKSFEYYSKAIAINEEIGNSAGVAELFGNIGNNYKEQDNYSKALTYYNKALSIYELLDEKYGIGDIYGHFGECYLEIAKDPAAHFTNDSLISPDKKTNLEKAILNLTKGIKISHEVGDVSNQIDFSLALSEAYSLSGNYTDAFKNLKFYVTLKDSVFSKENNQKIADLESKQEKLLKSKIDELQKKQQFIKTLSVLAGFLLMLVIIFIIFRSFNAQKRSNSLLGVAIEKQKLEKQKSDNLLLNILPAEVANELKETGTASAKHFDNVTILFTDFVNFTRVAEGMSPQELVAELHECFKAFDTIITKYNIEKIKTIGDAYMAVAGLPNPSKDHATNIAFAAIDIKRFMYERKQSMGDKTFDIRIGIHSGNVVAGIVGVKKFAYDIWGDTVNTAARMEQNSQPGKINISETTFQLIKHKFECTYRGEIEAKNKGIMKMYFINA